MTGIGATSLNSPHRVDLHSHFLPPEYVGHLQANDELVPLGWSVERHLDFMDSWGIAKSVVSVPQYFHFGDQAATTAIARHVNEEGRVLRERHGDRFAVHAALPLPDVSAATAELSYAFDELQLDGGVLLFTHYDGVYLGDPAYEDLYRELDRRGCVAWVHPPARPPHPSAPLAGHFLEMPFETTRAAAHLIYQGVLQRYPNIKWQVSHVGGALVHMLFRLAMLQVAPYAGLSEEAAPEGPFAAARRFYYDTAIAGSEEQLLSIKHLTGAERVVFGTDYPYVDVLFQSDARERWPWFGDMLPIDGDPEPALSRVFDRPERLLIERENALALYPELLR